MRKVMTDNISAPLHFNILTLFPDMFPGFLGQSLAGKALEDQKWSYNAINIRDHAQDKHKTVDDTPYGGGAGMVMRADVLEQAFLSIENPGKTLYMSPRGAPLTQKSVVSYIDHSDITILCGRYEGVDQRFLDAHNIQEVSIGDYVLSGGEPAAMIMMDACVRLLPGVMGNVDTAGEESFSESTGGLLEYPHYTRPASWQSANGSTYEVPDVLTSGNHAKISQWRRDQSLRLSKERRPDLLKK